MSSKDGIIVCEHFMTTMDKKILLLIMDIITTLEF